MSSGDTRDDFLIRRATLEDVSVLARQRCEMFKDMGQLQPEAYPELAAASVQYFAEALRSGEYAAWLAAPKSQPDLVVAGVGLQLRRILPRPDSTGQILRPGPQGLIVNIYTEKDWRRKGLADLIMQCVLEWSRDNGLSSLVVHASSMGRPLYERLGFQPTNEMYFPI